VVTDPWVKGLVAIPKWGEYAAMAVGVAFVVLLSKWIIDNRKGKAVSGGPAPALAQE